MMWNSERPNSEKRERWEAIKKGSSGSKEAPGTITVWNKNNTDTCSPTCALWESEKRKKSQQWEEGRNENGLMFTFVFGHRDISVSVGKEETTLRKLETTQNSLTRSNNYGSVSRLEAIALKIVQLRALVVYFCFRTGTRAIKWIRKTGNVCKAACVSPSYTSDTNLSCRMMGSLSHPNCRSDPLSQPWEDHGH